MECGKARNLSMNIEDKNVLLQWAFSVLFYSLTTEGVHGTHLEELCRTDDPYVHRVLLKGKSSWISGDCSTLETTMDMAGNLHSWFGRIWGSRIGLSVSLNIEHHSEDWPENVTPSSLFNCTIPCTAMLIRVLWRLNVSRWLSEAARARQQEARATALIWPTC